MASEQTLFEKYIKVRPRPVRGRFQTLRQTAILVLLGIFHLVPFLQWNGRQAILFDLAERRFFIFGLNIWPQDFILLTFVLISLVLVLFSATAVLGRVWCGYACPHTVYNEVFMWIEQKIEGNRSEQLKLARQSWNHPEKLRKRGLKYLLWLLVVLIAGIGFVGYFTPIRELIPRLFTLHAAPAAYFWVAFYGAFTWLQAGIVRERFCKFMCPYARFQGAMFDQNTLIIAYDEARGEPRRRLKKADREHPENLGFCVDCTMCVQVCPTGIDIRHGLQLGCIACAACIDACDNMMDQIDAPRGLIRYTSTHALKGKKTRVLRPKTLGYGGMLLLALSLIVFAIGVKSNTDLDIIGDRNMIARHVRGGFTQNSYTVKILNKSERPRRFNLSIENLPDGFIVDNAPFDVAASEVHEVVISINAPTTILGEKTSLPFNITATPEDAPEESVTESAVFNARVRRR